ncbi:hypothetical protein M1L60_32135 [Actinoplanes sp. TRM 88003]|uniref:Lipoprotein n=1 Tax=Paractinoplanes aksuensis TaxID=2939490 RepID=A0ABT1DWT3_9ACTN|nr:hypothetical protein [Actinoplanes aksuensis]MCO8275242.1 hypothetical protein [Actinoplanes aksuensis]
MKKIVFATVAVLVLAATAVVLRQRRAEPVPASSGFDPVLLAADALAALPSSPAPAAIEYHGPVIDGWSRDAPHYVGDLKLRLTCAGYGEMTVVLTGLPVKEAGTEPRELARATALCSLEPEPEEIDYVGDENIQFLTYAVTDATTAAGRAGFAVRVDAADGKPVTVHEYNRG